MASQSFPALQATGAFPITPSNSLNIVDDAGNTKDYEFCALYTSLGGDIKVTMLDGAEVTFAALPVGTFVPIQVKRVWVTGTTNVTGIIGLIGV